MSVKRGLWEASGVLDADGEKVSVSLYPEDKGEIKRRGYIVSWDKPEIVLQQMIPVLFEQPGGKRRLAKILTLGMNPDNDDSWVTVKRKR